MVDEVSSARIVCWNDDKSGCGGFSTEEELEKSIVLGKRNSVSVCGLEVDPKRIKLVGSDQNQQLLRERLLNGTLLDTKPPLGLSLKKTPSFVDLIQANLAQKRKRQKKEADKWKAGNLNAKYLRIGTWERRALRDLDLVAKCYYQKRKLVWEMLDNGLKSKIEIIWSDITAIRASFPQNNNAVLEIELRSAPHFFREINPQPRKHTIWQTSNDFTGGQAPKCRRHYLLFEEGTLKPHYEKLLQCDNRLFMLSQQPFPINRSPYFTLNMSGYQDYPFELNRPQPEFSHMLQFSHPGMQGPSYIPAHQAQMFETIPRASILAQAGLASPFSGNYSSVMEFPPLADHAGTHNIELQRSSIRGGTMKEENGYIEHGNQIQYFHQARPLMVQPVSYQYPPSSGDGLPRPPSTNSLLKDIANHLLNDQVRSACLNEQKLKARVESWCNLLELPLEQVSSNNTNTSDVEYSQTTTTSMSTQSTGESNENRRLMPQETAVWVPSMESNETPLMHLPKIQSFPDLSFEAALEELVGGGGFINGGNEQSKMLK